MFDSYSAKPERPWKLWGLAAGAVLVIVYLLLRYSVWQKTLTDRAELESVREQIQAMESVKQATTSTLAASLKARLDELIAKEPGSEFVEKLQANSLTDREGIAEGHQTVSSVRKQYNRGKLDVLASLDKDCPRIGRSLTASSAERFEVSCAKTRTDTIEYFAATSNWLDLQERQLTFLESRWNNQQYSVQDGSFVFKDPTDAATFNAMAKKQISLAVKQDRGRSALYQDLWGLAVAEVAP